MLFVDRQHAGQLLAWNLSAAGEGGPGCLVLGLPRGGVPVAAEVAERLHAPLDVFLVRKLGLPSNEEVAMGAIASGGIRVLNDDVLQAARVTGEQLARVRRVEEAELGRRERLYRGDRPPPRFAGREIIVVDDGLATGASMRAAITALRTQRPSRLVVAVPVGASEVCRELEAIADRVVCVAAPAPFLGVGRWYADFRPTSDDEVILAMGRHGVPRAA